MALLKAGLRGEPVRRMQMVLGVECDGAFGPKTEDALKKWQKDHALAADGIAGPDTFMMMGLWELMLLDKGSKGEAVKKLQEKLGVAADGKFGPGTEKALREYQQKNGLTADGMAGPATLSQMAIFREITLETVKRSEMPPDAVNKPKLPEAPAATAASKGQTAQPQAQAALSPPPSRSIWNSISRIFQ